MLARRRVNDLSANGRWSDASFMDFLTAAQTQLIRDILFPECRLTTATVPYIQEYQLPEIIAPGAVYLQGRLCVPTDIATMEGRQIGKWDQTGEGAVPPQPSGGPSGNIGRFSPKWTLATPSSFPEADSLDQCRWPVPSAAPWESGNRPACYVSGGYLGFVPAPSTGPVVINGTPVDNIDFRCVMTPPPIGDLNDTLWFPWSTRSPLAWRICVECAYSDETQISADRRNFAVQMYNQEKNQVRTDLQIFKEMGAPAGPKFNTGRRHWARGGFRRSWL
jgi:hypothetical protein